MVAILIYVVDSIRRALRKVVRGMSIIVESFHEAREFRRTMPRTYMEE